MLSAYSLIYIYSEDFPKCKELVLNMMQLYNILISKLMKKEKELILSYKFSLWRRYIVRRFFPELKYNIRKLEGIYKYLEYAERIKLLVWGMTLEEEGVEFKHPAVEVIRLEDGFIRSVGLGIRLTPPISLVADPMGIYYNSRSPSYLEHLLMNYSFDENLLERSRKLIDLINKYRISKYNLTGIKWKPPSTSRKIVVVPGQVETDMSIKYGSPVVKTNIELLKRVREFNSHEYIIYKPHPDVVGGYRKGYYDKRELLELCDEVCENCDNYSLIEAADEVHTINSLFGFEALLKRKKVVCYGQPFYSGWGLTEDLFPVNRRKRKLTLEKLVAVSLIIYPMYVSLFDGRRITPEDAIEELKTLKENPPYRVKLWSIIQKVLEPIFKIRKF